MKIQFNTGHNITASEKLRAPLEAIITDALGRFSSQITRLEVHLSDDDGEKNGENDKRCMIEARLKGMKPIAVTNHANTHEQAVDGAANKLKHTLNTSLDRLESKKGNSD